MVINGNPKKYYKIWTSNAYTCEIYDNCYARISVRGDGNRMRIRIDETYWRGNTGGLTEAKIYIDGRDNVHKAMRTLRTMQRRAIVAGESKHASVIADVVAGRDKDRLWF